MPPVRTETIRKTSEPLALSLSNFKFSTNSRAAISKNAGSGEELCDMKSEIIKDDINPVDLALQSKEDIYFPTTDTERKAFKTKEGRKVTSHQWAVYDVTRKIPCGKVTTYKDLCTLLGEGSPRSVGNALRHNPFAPFVPCHRIVSSDLRLGGFCGEWGTEGQEGSKCSKKVEMLAQEGVFFSEKGVLMDKATTLWNTSGL